MRRITKKIIAALVLLAIVFTFFGCSEFIEGLMNIGGAPEDDPGSVEFPGQDVKKEPDEWDGALGLDKDAVSVRVMRGDKMSLLEYIDAGTDTDTLEWRSRCDSIATVEDGTVTGVAAGKTLISASADGEDIAEFSVTVEFAVSQNNGFNMTSDVVDSTVYKVSSMYEANRIIDRAISRRVGELTIDFSLMSRDFSLSDFELDSEFGNHTSLRMLQYPGDPKITFEVIYKTDAASQSTPRTENNTYAPVVNANALIRKAVNLREGGVRADDFDGFAINKQNRGEMEVYNSEELWWALEQGYKPIFPKDTKAALFYERAKIILREIITDKMSEYEKVLAIYEYLVEAVAYDYDAIAAGAGKEDVCYYLEGVFETGRAVCDGKSKAFVLLCGIEGIECKRAFGDSLEGGAGHAWNYVSVSGNWYLVDTTEGDLKFDGSEITDFFGKNIEIVGYDAFLKPTSYHMGKYEYSDMWASISSEPYVRIDYFDTPIYSEYDFVLDSSEELLFMMDTLYGEGVSEYFVISFVTEGDAYWDYLRIAKGRYKFEYQAFTITYDFGAVHIVACSVK